MLVQKADKALKYGAQSQCAYMIWGVFCRRFAGQKEIVVERFREGVLTQKAFDCFAY